MRFAALFPVAAAFTAVTVAAPNTPELSSCNYPECCAKLYTQSEFESLYPSAFQALGNISLAAGSVGVNCSYVPGVVGVPFCPQLACCTGIGSGSVTTQAFIFGCYAYPVVAIK